MRDSNPRPPQCQCDALPTALTAHYLRIPSGDALPPLEKTFTGCFFFGRVLTAHYLRIPSGDALPPLEKTFTGCFFFGRVLTAHYLKNPFGRCATNLSKKHSQDVFFLRCENTRFFVIVATCRNFFLITKKTLSASII